MHAIVHDLDLIERILEERRSVGNRTLEEVWDGVIHLMPMPDNDHQDICARFGAVFGIAMGLGGPHRMQFTANISDRVEGWEQNFRNPDFLYFSKNCSATDCWTHWCGGPDFLVEVVTPNDACREKLPFYASIGTREALIIDRNPWRLELYQLGGQRIKLAGVSEPGRDALKSNIVPLSFGLLSDRPRPKIRITHTETAQEWTF